MAKSEWGAKHTCQECEARFYDLNRDPPVCPKCGTTVVREKPARPRRAAKAAPPEPRPATEEEKLAAADEVADKAVDDLTAGLDDNTDEESDDQDEMEAIGDDSDDGTMEDTSDIVGNDDMSEVLEHAEESTTDKP